MLQRASAACVICLVCISSPLFAASAAPAPATQPTLARRSVESTANVKAAILRMQAAKAEAIRKYDAGKGRPLVWNLDAKSAVVDLAAAQGPQARMNALSAVRLAQQALESGHLKAIEEDPGVAAATQAVAAAHAERETIRGEVDWQVRIGR